MAKCPNCGEDVSELKYYRLKADIEAGTFSLKVMHEGNINLIFNLVDFVETAKFLCPKCNAIIALSSKEAENFLKTGKTARKIGLI